MQFGLAQLLQFVTVTAIWCSVAIVQDKLVFGMAFVLVMVPLTWFIIGRWAVGLSTKNCRRVLAATATAMIVGGFFVTVFVVDEGYVPLVWMLTALCSGLGPWGAGLATRLALILFLLLVSYFFWLAVFGLWDWTEHFAYTSARDQGPVASNFTILIAILALPVLIVILFGGCYSFRGHGEGPNQMHHVAAHCVMHVGTVLSAIAVIVCMNVVCRRCTLDVSPDWLKLLVWGYLCLYAVLLQVALFPFNFYMP